MTDTQRARSQTELPDINYNNNKGMIQLNLGRTYVHERLKDRESKGGSISSKVSPMNKTRDRESSGQKISSNPIKNQYGVRGTSEGSFDRPNRNDSTIQTVTQPNFTFAEETGNIKGLTTGGSHGLLPI